MSAATHPPLRPGRVYRTRDLASWGANAPRLARRLVREGVLVPLAQGLFARPRVGRFGPVPPSDEELMRAFLGGSSFVFTGPSRWNALGLGTTAHFARPLVYNTKRSGTFELGGRRFMLRRVAFPPCPGPEWFVVDLFENAGQAATSPEALVQPLIQALRDGRFDPERLRRAAERYGTRATRDRVAAALAAVGA
jgi:hypothetical protein